MTRKVAGGDAGAPADLVAAILDPRSLANIEGIRWERLLSCARRNAVLAYLGHRAASAHVLDTLPARPRAALVSAQRSAARLAQLARWELNRVRRVLLPAGIPMIALKGVAYLMRGMPHARTRRLSDIDVMVPRDRIDAAEHALLASGWGTTVHDAYDQRYYRRWSHEIPPLLYPGRMLAVDVHHTICPPASRLRPDVGAFWANSISSSEPGVRLLAPADTVLHAAVHLFFDSDFDGRFRDLLDLRELVSTFGTDDAFWPALTLRARQQGLGRPLYHALEALSQVLATPIPPGAKHAMSGFRPPYPAAQWMNRTLATVLTPVDPQQWPPAHRLRLWLLYVRSHWLRMPAHHLLSHLARKSWRRLQRGKGGRV